MANAKNLVTKTARRLVAPGTAGSAKRKAVGLAKERALAMGRALAKVAVALAKGKRGTKLYLTNIAKAKMTCSSQS